jgi:glycosyltransferase involved in cell wall biosynthesis
MRLLMLTRYSRLGASSRLRSFQYIPYLRENGWDIHVSSLFSSRYLKALYSNKTRWLYIIKGYFIRIVALLSVYKFDIVWIEKECFPYLPAFAEKLLRLNNVIFLVDYDDAIFHHYDNSESMLIRKILGKKIDFIMKNANLVIAGNKYLAERAKQAHAKNIIIIPTVVDLDKYNKYRNRTKDIITIGWIGTPITSRYLNTIIPALEKIKNKFNVKIKAIGYDSKKIKTNSLIESVLWTEKNEVELINSFDIGIMPLPDEPFTRGKCGYKLIQYMACGLPVIASPVGVNTEIITHGHNGFLAETIDEWIDTLSLLLNDRELRIEMGEKGFNFTEQNYALQIQAPILNINMLQALM